LIALLQENVRMEESIEELISLAPGGGTR
jgi:hypothetical protein